MTKSCNSKKCKQPDKQLTEFHKNGKTKDGYHNYCKECRSIHSKENAETRKLYYKKLTETNPNYEKDRTLRSKYGINYDQYNELLHSQKGLCGICNKPETSIFVQTGKIKSLSVDHCHKTNVIRGLLCNSCNRVIGLLKDDPKILKLAINYLERWSS
jgi:hypothetical protein